MIQPIRYRERGSALLYILIAIALLAALTVVFTRGDNQQASSQSAVRAVSELGSQVNFIRTAIQECVLTYPAGDSTYSGSANKPYPLNPSDSHLTGPASDNEMQYLRCPGNPGDSADHAKIFGGNTGRFLPPAPNLFEPWQYYNGTDGVFFFIETMFGDAYLANAMDRLDEQFSECEADIVDATGGTAVEMTSTAQASDPKCPGGSLCFRIWVLAQSTASGAYNGDSDSDETSCP